MASRALWQLSVTTSPAAEEVVSELLAARFQQPATSYTCLETGLSTVSSFFETKPTFSQADRQALSCSLVNLAQHGFDPGPIAISLKKLGKRDWAQSWRWHFKPLHIGSSLLIKPSWSKQPARSGQQVVVLDPGLSFGTGQHPTTAFCLRQIVILRPRGKRRSFLDMGTGSGILAIAAAKLGYSPVAAFDHDAQAIRVACQNAKRNRVLRKIDLYEQDVTKLSRRGGRQFDLVCANLISNLLVEECDRIIDRVAPRGTLVLAGILAAEFETVVRAFTCRGMNLTRQRRQKEWSSGSFRKF